MPERAVIFDLDGTLVDTAPDLMLATNHVLATLGRRPITMQEVRVFVGHGARALIARGCEATGAAVSPRAVETLYQEFVIYYAQNIAQDSVAYPGLTGFLDRCRAEGIHLGICTNKLESLSIKLLEALGLRHYFGAIVGPDTIGVAKPDPKPFHETVARLGLRNASAVMVGDSEIDILTARAAGVPIIAVPFGYTPRPIAEYGPDFIVTHYDDMWETLGRAFER